jgi:flagellar P-ring protein FlgI
MRARRLFFLFWMMLPVSPVQAERLKDLGAFAGVRSNQLVGYGLVVGLNGTGDDNLPYTIQSAKSALARFGVTLPPTLNPGLKNAAAVVLTADLPAFAKPGQRIDVTVSAIGKAKSLRGGSLLMAPLLGADGNTYAIAQGNLAVGGLGIEGADGSKLTINVPSTGRIPDGASVERAVAVPLGTSAALVFNLREADFTTAQRVTDAINAAIGTGTAQPLDAVSIQVSAPPVVETRVALISVIENLQVKPSAAPARVIVNSRTGTIVMGADVRISPAAVSHGSLTVRVSEDFRISQPQPLSRGGETVVAPKSTIDATQKEARMFVFAPGAALAELVKAVNAIGASPADLVAILEALKQAGALKAELVII